jgi:hypothetical protein
VTRHQLLRKVKAENPHLSYGDNLFREATVFEAALQEGESIPRLANFTGMSKGEVKKHLIVIRQKLVKYSQEQKVKDIENYEPTEVKDDQNTATGGASVQPDADRPVEQSSIPSDETVDGAHDCLPVI